MHEPDGKPESPPGLSSWADSEEGGRTGVTIAKTQTSPEAGETTLPAEQERFVEETRQSGLRLETIAETTRCV